MASTDPPDPSAAIRSSGAAGPELTDDPLIALQMVEPELAKLRKDELQAPNVDLMRALAISGNIGRNVRRLLPEIRRQLPLHPLEPLQKIETYAMAAMWANVMCNAEMEDPKKLLDEALELRRDLLLVARSPALAGAFDAARLRKVGKKVGYLRLGNDLIALAGIYDDAWPTIAGRSKLTQENIKRAATLGKTLLVWSEKNRRVSPGTERRDRAFTLLLKVIEDARDAVRYVRRKERDVDLLVPSLLANPGASARRPRDGGAGGDGGAGKPTQGGAAKDERRRHTARAARGARGKRSS